MASVTVPLEFTFGHSDRIRSVPSGHFIKLTHRQHDIITGQHTSHIDKAVQVTVQLSDTLQNRMMIYRKMTRTLDAGCFECQAAQVTCFD